MELDKHKFAAKTVVITGAAGNFGREGARYFALRGANVVALDMNKDALLDAVEYVKHAMKTRDLKRREAIEARRQMELEKMKTEQQQSMSMGSNKKKGVPSLQCNSRDAIMESMTGTMSFLGSELNDKVIRSRMAMEVAAERSTACVADTVDDARKAGSSIKCATPHNLTEEDFWNDPGSVFTQREVIMALQCDVTDEFSVKECMETAVQHFGGIDLVWNNAGYQGDIKPTLDYRVSDFDKVMRINVTGMFTVLQAASRHMVTQNKALINAGKIPKRYSIVNTASVAGLRGTPAMVAYASSKAAVLAMTVSTSKDLAPYGIRVNAVSPALIGPGYMWTRQNELHAASGSPYFANDPDEVARNKVNGVPMKRLGSVEEVLHTVAFLLSDDSSYTTGSNLVVDGGMSAGLKA
uniref:Uncharacterized protein n=1 Tax=Leptocylindrus danicus TaxID=163516 RepID=A0A7S2K7T2_9STRA|mmetsp:Transcript_19475/g.28996  ORF Transcript_19475/g.28996 Transcript_19475/m.28996 type:complete len:410 (+) Transcript_19475:98-1327(+)